MSKKRKKTRFWLSFVLGLFFWMVWLLIVFFVEPETLSDLPFSFGYWPFFTSLGLALFFSLALIFRSSRRGLFFSLGIILWLVLRLLDLGNWLNGILILGTIIGLDLYLSKR